MFAFLVDFLKLILDSGCIVFWCSKVDNIFHLLFGREIVGTVLGIFCLVVLKWQMACGLQRLAIVRGDVKIYLVI